MRVLVIGDSCEDIFVYGDVSRLNPEAPVPILHASYSRSNPGMAGNVHQNLLSLGISSELITNSEVIKKTRYVCERSNYILLRIDENDVCRRITNQVLLGIKWSDYHAVIVSDYCKGFLNSEDLQHISNNHNNVFLDTKRKLSNWAKNYRFIKLNYLEYLNNKDSLEENNTLYQKTIITRGSNGCDFRGVNYPTSVVPVKDVSGAGDTFIAGLVFNYVKTDDILSSIIFAQECTLKVIQKKGVSTV